MSRPHSSLATKAVCMCATRSPFGFDVFYESESLSLNESNELGRVRFAHAAHGRKERYLGERKGLSQYLAPRSKSSSTIVSMK